MFRTKPSPKPPEIEVKIHFTSGTVIRYRCEGVRMHLGGSALLLHNVTADPDPTDPVDIGIPMDRVHEWRERVL